MTDEVFIYIAPSRPRGGLQIQIRRERDRVSESQERLEMLAKRVNEKKWCKEQR